MNSIILERALRIDTAKLTGNIRDFVITNDIQNVLVLDDTAIEEILIFLLLKLTVYVDFDNKYIKFLFKKELKNIKPTSELMDKADLLLLPTDSTLARIDIDDERKKIRKKGFIVYKIYNYPKKREPAVLLQQCMNGIGFMTTISSRLIAKTIITRQDTCCYTLDRDELMEPSDIKSAIKFSGFRKTLVIDENGEPFDEQTSKLAYRIYRKAKSVPINQAETEENLPLMTSGEISDRFSEIMDQNKLKREDFEL